MPWLSGVFLWKFRILISWSSQNLALLLYYSSRIGFGYRPTGHGKSTTLAAMLNEKTKVGLSILLQ
jgi:hypothetical protein